MFPTLFLSSLFLGQSDPAAEQLFEKMKTKLAQAKTVQCSVYGKLEGVFDGHLKASLALRVKENQASVQIQGLGIGIKTGYISDGKQAAARSFFAVAKTGKTPNDLGQRLLTALAYSGLIGGGPLYLEPEKSPPVE